MRNVVLNAANRTLKGLNKKVDILCNRLDKMEGSITILQRDMRKMKEHTTRKFGEMPSMETPSKTQHPEKWPIDKMLEKLGVTLNEFGEVEKKMFNKRCTSPHFLLTNTMIELNLVRRERCERLYYKLVSFCGLRH